MEEHNNFEDEIKKEIKAAIDFQQSQMESVIRCNKRKNEYLSQLISSYSPAKPVEFPTLPQHPSNELIERYYETHRKLNLARRNLDRLYQTHRHLSVRITNAHEILQREKQEKHNRAILAFSPTVAKLKDIRPQTSNISKPSVIESTMFKEQLEAIEKLKNGFTPRQYGEIKYDFDGEIKNLDREIERVQSENNDLLQKITTNINRFLQDSTAIKNELMQREKDMSSFKNFAQTYYNSNNEIEKLKYIILHQVMKSKRDEIQNKRIDELISHLSSEKQMIDEQLSSFGDDETNKLKSEIEFQKLYLGHLTAIAGKALSKMSTEKEPADPVLEMKAEIMSMEHKLSRSSV